MTRLLSLALLLATASARAELPDISTVPADLTMPPLAEGAPAAGRRVFQATPGWEGTEVHHQLYLPSNWAPERKWPVIVEYAGNGGFEDKFGDRCDGTVEGCRIGYGLSAGRDYIWICAPYVEVKDGKRNARNWWGDQGESARYAVALVRDVCARYGGDPKRVVLCGFSRGSIGCNFIGLRDDEVAALWCGMLCHSHYDGVRPNWPYPGADRPSALVRLQRLRGRPQLISQENGGTSATRDYLGESGVAGDFTFVDFQYRNHTDTWALCDCELRQKARAWLQRVAPAQ